MPRQTRVHLEGALNYVTSRALDGTPLFRDDRDYEMYSSLLSAYQERYQFKLFAFVLLPDHLHLCLELTNRTTISAIMHDLNSRYTKYFAKRYGHAGHVFQERFKLTLLEKAPSLLRVTGYLHTHPRRCGVTEDIQGYRWSSGSRYLAAGNTSRPGLCNRGEVAEVLEQLSRERPAWTYALYLQSIPDAEWEQVRGQLTHPVVGSEAFLTSVEERRRRVPSADAAHAYQPIEPQPAPAPGRAARRPFALTLSVAIAAVALVTALFSTRAVVSSQRAIRALAQENQQVFAALLSGLGQSAGVRLASFMRPQHLTGTSWDVRLHPLFAGSDHAETDQLQFARESVTSARLAGEGFSSSRYRLTRQGDGAVIWEAIQAGPDGEIASWRGTWNGTTMEGTLTRQPPSGASASFRFVGINLREGNASNQPKSET